MSTPLYFCLRIPEFAAQALVRLRPTLAKAAVAVLEGDPPLEKACAATLQARRLGVRHGMTRAELESFPNLTVLRRSLAEEQNAALALLEMAARFTPRTEELPRTEAFHLALDLSGSHRLLGPPHVIGQKLFRAARELGFFARIAGSRNLHTALCLVRAPGNQLITVPPGEERTHLHGLPLTALDLTPELHDTFNAWGLRTLGDLAALLPADLVARLGQEGLRLHQLASGQFQHLLVPAEPAFTLEEHLAFDSPVDNLESLLFVLAPMLDQLIYRARTRALLLGSLTVRLHLERSADQTDRNRQEDPAPEIVNTAPGLNQPQIKACHLDRRPKAVVERPASAPAQASVLPSSQHDGWAEPVPTHLPPTANPQRTTLNEPIGERPIHERILKPALPLDDRNLLLKLLQLDLQSHPAPAAIVAITLHAEPGPRPGVQSGLFSPQSPEPMRLEVTLARLAALVGDDRVGRAVLTDNHRPQSFRMERFTVTLPDTPSRKRRKQPEPLPTPATRTGVALRRLRPAPAVQVKEADGRPHQLTLHTPALPATHYTVARAFGPWRSSGHWWSTEVWSQEEWDIDAHAPDGTRLLALLTNNRLHMQWQLHALYD
jgi:nucleotidyltransferase/DNA polymerase involved in DNA repair